MVEMSGQNRLDQLLAANALSEGRYATRIDPSQFRRRPGNTLDGKRDVARHHYRTPLGDSRLELVRYAPAHTAGNIVVDKEIDSADFAHEDLDIVLKRRRKPSAALLAIRSGIGAIAA